MTSVSEQKRGQDWTRMLAEAGLETPGYREAFDATTKLTALKREQAKNPKKSKSKKRK